MFGRTIAFVFHALQILCTFFRFKSTTKLICMRVILYKAGSLSYCPNYCRRCWCYRGINERWEKVIIVLSSIKTIGFPYLLQSPPVFSTPVISTLALLFRVFHTLVFHSCVFSVTVCQCRASDFTVSLIIIIRG